MIFNNNFSIYSALLFCFFVPVELEKYDVIIIPVSSLNQAKRSKDKEDVRPKRPNFRSGLKIRKDVYNKMDMEEYVEPTEMPDVDNFHYIDRTENSKEIERYGRSDGDQDIYKRYNFDYSFGDDKIVGGSEVDINLYPYHVGYGTNCGGALIGSKWVMTAGHCGRKPYIRVGSKFLNQGRKITVTDTHVHPEWSGSSKEHPFDYDFQVLELEETLKFTDDIQPVKIARIEDMVIGKVITVTGWGNTEENGPYSNVLRAVRVPIISKENCQRVPFPYFRGQLTPRMFCAGFQEGKKDACQGDSGGPAVANDRLLGMVSFGYGCATPGSYGVYSKVAKVRNWIEEVTGLTLD